MADIPDFRVKTPAIDPMAFANVLQRKAEIEQNQRNLEQKRKDDRITNLMDAVKTGQQVASNMMNLAEKRRQTQGLNDLTNLMSQPPIAPPSPTASSTEVGSNFPVAPSPEQNQAYQQSLQDRQGAMTSALAKANPEEFTKFASKSVFAQPKLYDLQSKQVLYNGQPAEVLFDNKTGDFYDASTKQHLTGKIEPYSPNQSTELTDADRKRLTPLAKAVIEGRATPSTLVAARGAEKEKLSLVASELDPSFDLSLAPQRMQMRREFTPAGQSGKSLTALNTVIGHLDTLNSKIDKLDNKQITKYNTIQNYVKKNTGKSEVDEFNATKVFVEGELGKIAQGSGVVTNEERKQISDSINSSSSPAQAKAVISTWMDLMKSRTDAIKANWNQTMGGNQPPTPFINDKSKKILVKNGYNPDTLEKNDNASDPAMDTLASVLGLKKKGK